MDTHVDRSVKAMYEQFPYPPPFASDDYLRDIQARQKGLAFGPSEAFHTFFPERAQTQDLDILVAGCGTTLGAAMAASMPGARVVAIDISGSALDVSAKAATRAGLSNIQHHLLPLEEVPSLGKTFDLILATGVLHHLASPGDGLKALAKVLRPNGAISAMVYGAHGRTGVYLLQELFRMLGLEANEKDAAIVQKILPHVPATHPIQLVGLGLHQPYPLAEITDLMLHPRDRAFTVHDVRALVSHAGLKFHRWVGQSPYHLEAAGGLVAELAAQFVRMNRWDRYRALELFRGDMHQHTFVATHPHRRNPEELFQGDGLLDATPVLHRELDFQREGRDLVIHNRSLWRPIPIRAEAAPLLAVLRSIDGTSSIREILARDMGASLDESTIERAKSIFWHLYRCDVIDLACLSAAD